MPGQKICVFTPKTFILRFFSHLCSLVPSRLLCQPWRNRGIPSLLIQELTLPTFPEWFCLPGPWSTTQELSVPVGEGPRARVQQQVTVPAFNLRSSDGSPLSWNSAEKLSHMSYVSVEVGGWFWRWWWHAITLLLAGLNIGPHLRAEAPRCAEAHGTQSRGFMSPAMSCPAPLCSQLSAKQEASK